MTSWKETAVPVTAEAIEEAVKWVRNISRSTVEASDVSCIDAVIKAVQDDTVSLCVVFSSVDSGLTGN